MAIKESELYSSLWASCDRLPGGMDVSQYKDYVLYMLFIKYISDKYVDTDDFSPPVTIPSEISFKVMVKLKSKSNIGDMINIQIIQPLIDNNSSIAHSHFPDFNDPNKISIFQKPALDFSKNRIMTTLSRLLSYYRYEAVKSTRIRSDNNHRHLLYRCNQRSK